MYAAELNVILHISDGASTLVKLSNSGFGTNVEQGFSSFFAKFLAYLMIFQSGAHGKHYKTLQYSSNMPIFLCHK